MKMMKTTKRNRQKCSDVDLIAKISLEREAQEREALMAKFTLEDI
jgi:hypothetical protein